MISSGESSDEASKAKAASKQPAAGRRGRGPASGVPVPCGAHRASAPERAQGDGVASKEALFSGSSLDAELAKAAAAFAEGETGAEQVAPVIEPKIPPPAAPAVPPHGDVLVKEDVPAPIASVLPPDLQVSALWRIAVRCGH